MWCCNIYINIYIMSIITYIHNQIINTGDDNASKPIKHYKYYYYPYNIKDFTSL